MDTGRPETLPFSQAAASLRLLESAGTTHEKPPFGLTRTRIGDRTMEVREESGARHALLHAPALSQGRP
jgi:poly-beta-hydroxyalkanoate depolymerase